MDSERYYALIRGRHRGPGATALRAGLRLLSWPYGLGMRVRNALYDRGWKRTVRAAVPVLSVGNLTLGGTGKTPCVEYLAGLLRDRGIRPVILSRGYGAEHHRNDEAMVLEENLPDVPHLQGADRVALASMAVEELEAEAIVLDDGFQHRRLGRDLDLVLLDATAPIESEAMFPRGLLREPIAGLRRADVMILTRCNQVDDADRQAAWLRNRFPGKLVARAVHEPVALIGPDVEQPLDELANRPVGAFCGIGNPDAFRLTLDRLGVKLIAFRTFADHHAYSRDDVADLDRWAGTLPAGAIVATTQKDWVKLRVGELGGRPLRAVRIGFKLTEGEAELTDLIVGLFARGSVGPDADELD